MARKKKKAFLYQSYSLGPGSAYSLAEYLYPSVPAQKRRVSPEALKALPSNAWNMPMDRDAVVDGLLAILNKDTSKTKFAEFINQVPSRDELRAILKWDPEGKGDISK